MAKGGVSVPKSREEKAQELAELRDKMGRAQAMVLTSYNGLTVAEISELRNRLRESRVEFRVVKNTLARLVAKELGLDGLSPHLEGPTAIAFGLDDPVAPAKGIADFVRDQKKMEIKAGVLEGRIIGVDTVQALAELPPKQELLAKVLGAVQSPLVGLASVLNAPLRGFVTALAALRDRRQAEA